MYQLPKSNYKKAEKILEDIFNNKFNQAGVLVAIILIALGILAGTISISHFTDNFKGVLGQASRPISPETINKEYVSSISYEQAIINTVKEASPSVVSIVISKNLPVYEQQFINPFGDFPQETPFDFQIPQYIQKGTELKEVGAGSGFIISTDGLVLTNKHVVSDKQAEYTVITNEGTKYSASVLALDPVQDLAIIKIKADNPPTDGFRSIKLGDSNGIKIGQGAIAIGNALGQFSNTVSVGVVSGLGRTVSAQGRGGFSETLENIIQTDAAINPGNSGGPLLNLKGEVIGVNVATAEGAQSIGFAIPINIAKRDIAQIIATNKIVYPFLGVRYVAINDAVKAKYELNVDYGALVLRGEDGEAAVTKGSAAEKAGIKENDIILNINGEKITEGHAMSTIIQKYNPGDTVTLHILRSGKEMDVEAALGERS